MPITVAPASASARANSRWLAGKNGSTKTTFMPGMVAAGDRLRSAAAGDDIGPGGYVLSMMVAGFVAPYLLDTTTRFVDAAAGLPDVRLALITCEPADRLPPELRRSLAAHWRIDDPLDPGQIAGAVRGSASSSAIRCSGCWPCWNSCRCRWARSASTWASPGWTRPPPATSATRRR